MRQGVVTPDRQTILITVLLQMRLIYRREALLSLAISAVVSAPKPFSILSVTVPEIPRRFRIRLPARQGIAASAIQTILKTILLLVNFASFSQALCGPAIAFIIPPTETFPVFFVSVSKPF
jgi:hypothetical protein